jgi:hypothetical protein
MAKSARASAAWACKVASTVIAPAEKPSRPILAGSTCHSPAWARSRRMAACVSATATGIARARILAASFHEGLPQRAKEAIKTVGQGDGAVFEDEHARAQRREALRHVQPLIVHGKELEAPPGTRITAGATCVGGRGEGMGSSSGRETL